MSIFTKIWAFIKKIGAWTVEHAAPTVVAIVEQLQTLWNSGTPGFIASVLDSLTKSGIPTEVVNAIGKALPTILANALAVEGLPTNPSPIQLAAFEQRILDAIGIHDSKSKIYTVVSADIFAMLQRDLQPGVKYTFAMCVAEIEEAFQDYKNALANEGGDNVATE